MIRNIIFVLSIILAAACTAPTTKVTLLPDENGKTGKVVIKSKKSSVELTQPYTFVAIVDEGEKIEVRTATPKTIQLESEQLFENEPEKTVHFILYFEYDSTRLTDESRRLVPKIISAIIDRKYAEINIIGHTDTKGSDKHNIELSLQRATEVEKILRSYYREMKDVYIQSFGEKDLLIPTADDVSEERNRRVEIMIR